MKWMFEGCKGGAGGGGDVRGIIGAWCFDSNLHSLRMRLQGASMVNWIIKLVKYVEVTCFLVKRLYGSTKMTFMLIFFFYKALYYC